MAVRGRPKWEPTADERRLIEHYAAIGYTQEQTAALLDKSIDSLQRHCRRELDLGALQVNAKIGGALFKKAMSGDSAALIFWCKTRLGWKETTIQQHELTDETKARLEAALGRLGHGI